MKIVVPVAGRDSRYPEHFGTPKPLVPIKDSVLLRHTFDTLGFNYESDFSTILFICHPDDEQEYALASELRHHFPFANVDCHMLSGSTQGAACTVLSAKDTINDDEPLIVYLADIVFEPEGVFKDIITSLPDNVDGLIPCFPSEHEKYSYAVTKDDRVVRVAEKKVISNNASAGLYYFRRGRDFVTAAETMIQDDAKRVNNVFYICPVYNELVQAEKHVTVLPSQLVIDLGHFESLQEFMATA